MPTLDTFRGDTAEIRATVSGVVLDDAFVRFTAKRVPTDADVDALIVKTSDDGITVAGQIATIALEPADTAELRVGSSLFCDIQVTDGVGSVATVWTGRLRILRDISVTTP
jgi:hypothetical protein